MTLFLFTNSEIFAKLRSDIVFMQSVSLEGDIMADNDKIDRLEVKFSTLEQQVSTVAAKVDMIIGELHEQREDNRRIQKRQDAMQEQHNADMREMREDIKGAVKHIQNLTIASMVGIGAIAIATWVFVLTK